MGADILKYNQRFVLIYEIGRLFPFDDRAEDTIFIHSIRDSITARFFQSPMFNMDGVNMSNEFYEISEKVQKSQIWVIFFWNLCNQEGEKGFSELSLLKINSYAKRI